MFLNPIILIHTGCYRRSRSQRPMAECICNAKSTHSADFTKLTYNAMKCNTESMYRMSWKYQVLGDETSSVKVKSLKCFCLDLRFNGWTPADGKITLHVQLGRKEDWIFLLNDSRIYSPRPWKARCLAHLLCLCVCVCEAAVVTLC